MVIISNKPGQLGNRLFVFSNWIAYAIEQGEVILNPAFDEYAEFFQGTYDQKISRFPAQGKSGQPVAKNNFNYTFSNYFSRTLHRLHINNRLISNTYLDWDDRLDIEQLGKIATKYFFAQGWLFRAKNWLVKHRETIRSFFDIVEPHRSRVDNFIGDLKNSYDVIIGIHIRHGDYATFEGGRYFYSFETYKEQVSKLYRQLENQRPVFILCSNVPVDLEDFSGLPCVQGPGHFVEDLYVLSECDYLLGPPSTFTMWASFYGSVPLKFIKDLDEPYLLEEFNPYS